MYMYQGRILNALNRVCCIKVRFYRTVLVLILNVVTMSWLLRDCIKKNVMFYALYCLVFLAGRQGRIPCVIGHARLCSFNKNIKIFRDILPTSFGLTSLNSVVIGMPLAIDYPIMKFSFNIR